MNTAAALLGIVGSLLLIIQPAIALWLRQEIRQTRADLVGDKPAAPPAAAGATFDVSRPAAAVPPRPSPGEAVDTPEAAFEKAAARMRARIDDYRPWQAWSMIAGALCLALSYLFAALAANLA